MPQALNSYNPNKWKSKSSKKGNKKIRNPKRTLFAIFFGMSVWASLYLQRHKVRDVAMGAVSFFIAFVLAYVYTGFMI